MPSDGITHSPEFNMPSFLAGWYSLFLFLCRVSRLYVLISVPCCFALLRPESTVGTTISADPAKCFPGNNFRKLLILLRGFALLAGNNIGVHLKAINFSKAVLKITGPALSRIHSVIISALTVCINPHKIIYRPCLDGLHKPYRLKQQQCILLMDFEVLRLEMCFHRLLVCSGVALSAPACQFAGQSHNPSLDPEVLQSGFGQRV